ncbi:tripartite tricarboxylate transporter substrate binding protein [uncultured Pigmentiphaga sp.]|jgi:Uncharacterized protein conserved in bacteria|uniref:tripartite tricarboxylate transporter substrate binding protein n=1 Tax=uncultured Pigmentiphaga sp. TaxID=340361 RepID=UPI002628DCD7|nr:tripartite tricarboxylate transporter substrate binding protein [uncultured Pigmentiphaga sp.]
MRVTICAGLSLLIGSVTAVTAATAASPGGTFPERTIKLLLPFAPGGNPDTVSRILAQELTKSLGQAVVVENRAGANAIIATDLVAKAPADGYTLLYTTGSHVINPILYRSLPYDTDKDFTPVVLVGSTRGQVLVVNPSLPAANVQELIQLARSTTSNITYGSAGIGNTMHLVAEYFNYKAGTHMVHVPYKGAAPAMNAVMSGEVKLAFLNPVSAIEQVKHGKLRALGVTGSTRFPQMPDVPTIAEAGVPGFEVQGGWQGVFAPAGTPPEVVAKLNKAFNDVMASPAIRQRFESMGLDVAGGSPEDMSRYLAKETEIYQDIARAAKIEKQ